MALVLIVDDSKFTRNRLRKMLADASYEVLEAGNGREALDQIDAQEPDCVITDLNMPVLTGLQLLQELRERNAEYPILVLSADVQEPVRQECLALGALAFLSKPPNGDALVAALSEALAGRKESP